MDVYAEYISTLTWGFVETRSFTGFMGWRPWRHGDTRDSAAPRFFWARNCLEVSWGFHKMDVVLMVSICLMMLYIYIWLMMVIERVSIVMGVPHFAINDLFQGKLANRKSPTSYVSRT